MPEKEPLFFEDTSDEEEGEEKKPVKSTADGKNDASRSHRTPSPRPVNARKRERASSPPLDVGISAGDDVIDISDSPISKVKPKPSVNREPQHEAKQEEYDGDIVMISAQKGSSPSNAEAGPSRSKAPPSSALTCSSDPSSRIHTFKMGFIGEYYTTGYSLNKGKGYVTNDAPIHIERNKSQEEKDREKAEKLMKNGKDVGGVHVGSRTTVIKNGKVVKGSGSAMNGKQGTLSFGTGGKKADGTAAKKPPPKASPADNIIRFRNARGFEVGRIPTKDAAFLAPLLDADLIHLDGYVMECPPVLTMGCDITLCLRVYLKRPAFVQDMDPLGKGKGKERDGEGGTFWQQQGETDQERRMRLRKEALGQLFNRVDLKPIRTSALVKDNNKKNGKGAQKIDDVEFLDPETQFDSYIRARSQSRSASPKKRDPSARNERGSSPTKGKTPKGKASRNSSPSTGKRKSGVSSVNSDDEGSDADSGDEAELLNEEQLNELDVIYQRAQRNDGTLQEMEPPSTFTYTLRPYQKQALHWMNALETGATDVRDQSMHPLWEEYAFKRVRAADAAIDLADEESSGEKFFFNPYDGDLSLEFPRAQSRARGGILADAMGMGKTCMLASLIHTIREGDVPPGNDLDPAEDDQDGEPAAKRPKFRQITLSTQWRPVASRQSSGQIHKRPHATLVICPVSLAKQWQEELDRMSVKGSLKVRLWYGNDRPDLDALLDADPESRADVLITSYGTLTSEHLRWQKSKDKHGYEGGSLFDIEWLRIVLDEAHTIKNRASRGAKACFDLKAQRRWALSGTPIVNRLEDLYSLLHYLQLEPWGQYSFFRSFVTVPFLAQDPKAIDVVQFILEQCLLRREKTMRDKDGRLIVDLPPKTIKIEKLAFSRMERKIYDAIYDRSRRAFIKMDQEGQIKSAYTSILAMLMKLRQAVDHPLLVMHKSAGAEDMDDVLTKPSAEGEEDLGELIAKFAQGAEEKSTPADLAFASQALQKLGNAASASECVVCTGEAEAEVVMPCWHTGCRDCVQSLIEAAEDKGQTAGCPACSKGPLTLESLKEVKRSKNGLLGENGGVSLRKVDFQTSTKLKALVASLQSLRGQDPVYKALVFSQFTSMLSLVEPALTDSGIDYLRFDGSLSQKERALVVEAFAKPSRNPKVLLISLKAGGVGLNLTAANHVYMLDCWWNEAIEQQAIDRVHRLGQNKPVFVTRFVIKKTIERRILKIQKSKTALVNASLQGGGGGGGAMDDIKAIFGLTNGDDDSSDEDD